MNDIAKKKEPAEKHKTQTANNAGQVTAICFWKNKSRPKEKSTLKECLLQSLANYLVKGKQSKYLAKEAYLYALLSTVGKQAARDDYACATKISENDLPILRKHIDIAKKSLAENLKIRAIKRAGQDAARGFWKNKSKLKEKTTLKECLLQSFANYLVKGKQSKYLAKEAYLCAFLSAVGKQAEKKGYACAIKISENDHPVLRGYIDKATEPLAENLEVRDIKYTGRTIARNFWKNKSGLMEKTILKECLLQNLASYLVSRGQSKYLEKEAYLRAFLSIVDEKVKENGYACAMEISENDHPALRKHIDKATTKSLAENLEVRAVKCAGQDAAKYFWDSTFKSTHTTISKNSFLQRLASHLVRGGQSKHLTKEVFLRALLSLVEKKTKENRYTLAVGISEDDHPALRKQIDTAKKNIDKLPAKKSDAQTKRKADDMQIKQALSKREDVEQPMLKRRKTSHRASETERYAQSPLDKIDPTQRVMASGPKQANSLNKRDGDIKAPQLALPDMSKTTIDVNRAATNPGNGGNFPFFLSSGKNDTLCESDSTLESTACPVRIPRSNG